MLTRDVLIGSILRLQNRYIRELYRANYGNGLRPLDGNSPYAIIHPITASKLSKLSASKLKQVHFLFVKDCQI
jgi:hypothetical protein